MIRRINNDRIQRVTLVVKVVVEQSGQSSRPRDYQRTVFIGRVLIWLSYGGQWCHLDFGVQL